MDGSRTNKIKLLFCTRKGAVEHRLVSTGKETG